MMMGEGQRDFLIGINEFGLLSGIGGMLETVLSIHFAKKKTVTAMLEIALA